MKSLLQILQFISAHPLAKRNKFLAYKNFIRWQLLQLINPKKRVCKYVEDSSLLIEKGMVGATGNIYCGLLEFEDMAFVLHFLRPGDLLGDVGANIGAYTILAAKNTGAYVTSIEPVPGTFQHLKNNVALNKIEKLVTLYNCGASSKNDELLFTNGLDAVNHVVLDNENDNVIRVAVKTLDSIFNDGVPQVLKIDVEGYEYEVIKGGEKLLKSETLKAIIIELNGSGMRYGFSDTSIHNTLMAYGFLPHAYNPFSRTISPLESPGNFNTLYLRNTDFIMNKITTARKFSVLGQEI